MKLLGGKKSTLLLWLHHRCWSVIDGVHVGALQGQSFINNLLPWRRGEKKAAGVKIRFILAWTEADGCPPPFSYTLFSVIWALKYSENICLPFACVLFCVFLLYPPPFSSSCTQPTNGRKAPSYDPGPCWGFLLLHDSWDGGVVRLCSCNKVELHWMFNNPNINVLQSR